jgi:hypothetical protein
VGTYKKPSPTTFPKRPLVIRGQALFDVSEGGQVHARFGDIQFPPQRARMFAANADTEENWATYFSNNGMPGLAALFREDWEALRACNQDQRAIARRVGIVRVTQPLILRDSAQMDRIRQSNAEIVAAGKAREAAYRAKRQRRQ